MLKRIALLASVMVMASLPAAAGPACSGADDLSWLVAPQATVELLSTPEPIALGERRQAPFVRCSATASCAPHTSVTCSHSAPNTCVAVDRNCPSQRGYVTCNGVTTYCPICPTACSDGQLRGVWTGECCAENGKNKYLEERCIGGEWTPTGSYSCKGLCNPLP